MRNEMPNTESYADYMERLRIKREEENAMPPLFPGDAVASPWQNQVKDPFAGYAGKMASAVTPPVGPQPAPLAPLPALRKSAEPAVIPPPPSEEKPQQEPDDMDKFLAYQQAKDQRARMTAAAGAGQGVGGVSGAIAPVTSLLATSGSLPAVGAAMALNVGAGLFDAYGTSKEKERAEKKLRKAEQEAELAADQARQEMLQAKAAARNQETLRQKQGLFDRYLGMRGASAARQREFNSRRV